MDKFNAWRVVNMMENALSNIENAVRSNSGTRIKETKQVLLALQRELQNEIERKT